MLWNPSQYFYTIQDLSTMVMDIYETICNWTLLNTLQDIKNMWNQLQLKELLSTSKK